MDDLSELKNLWQESKVDISDISHNFNDVIAKSKEKIKNIIGLHIKTLAILTFTLVGISAFFIYVAPFQALISRVGIFLMTGGLMLRIFIECYSMYQSSKVDMGASAVNMNQSLLRFSKFRKRILGQVTFAILIAYTIGFYLLTPEFSLYISVPFLVLIDASYLLGAVIVGYFIRRGIRDEIGLLAELTELQKTIVE